MSTEAEWAVIYVSQGPLVAEVVKSKLESYAVPVFLRYEAIGRTLGLTVDGLGKVEVLVPVSRAAEARDLLAEADLLPSAENEVKSEGESSEP
ncbi:MAG: DUF2007 domain-containing protein [Chloroflexi bacterium]|nr:DUF2007 domain-containing protein [Chloroflexota bacterium]